MNTRIQVEHPVTEMVTGVDLVKWQLRIAGGEHLTLTSGGATIQGHAMECRLNAEDAARGFAPEVGTIRAYVPPGGPGIRVDSHLFAGYEVPPYYDSLLGKIVAWGETRAEAISRMRRALSELIVEGVRTTREFHLEVLQHPSFLAGSVQTNFVERHFPRGEQITMNSALSS
ncbi:MAG: acetyl-CoA carboxylase biotin carboxylase subunit, partial [Chloroflexi bacterium]|nr:acetyl-CoA carboxylase biotin carboxylase subunit [Chloroflexota bacterium]